MNNSLTLNLGPEQTSNDVQLELDFTNPEPALLSDDFIITSSDDNIIDLSGVGAASTTFTGISGGYSNVSISNVTLQGSGSGYSYNYGNVITNTGVFSVGNLTDSRPEIVVSDGTTQIGLLATLKQWSKALGLPLSIQNIENKNEIVQQIYKDWQRAADEGKLDECKKFAEQYEIIDQLTKDSKKNEPEI